MKNLKSLTIGAAAVLTLAYGEASLAAGSAKLSVEEALVLACAEADRIEYQFDSTCEDDFGTPHKITKRQISFLGFDASGDCTLLVRVDRVTGQATSKVTCD